MAPSPIAAKQRDQGPPTTKGQYMADTIHELIDEIVTEFDLTDADVDQPSWQNGHLHLSRTDVARLIRHIRRQETYLDAFLAQPAVADTTSQDHADEAPDTPALDAWAEAHPYGSGSDRPRTSLWFPHETPWVQLGTVNVGGFHDPVERLPDPERVTCHVHLGTTMDIGGYLSEMQSYFAAVVEAIGLARQHADRLTQAQSEVPAS